jgi:excisionase family DNA binding protein
MSEMRLAPDQLEQLARMLNGNQTPPLMDAEQAAGFLQVPVSWVRAEARAGRIPHVKLGRYTRFRTAELEAWVDGRQVGPVGRRTAR